MIEIFKELAAWQYMVLIGLFILAGAVDKRLKRQREGRSLAKRIRAGEITCYACESRPANTLSLGKPLCNSCLTEVVGRVYRRTTDAGVSPEVARNAFQALGIAVGGVASPPPPARRWEAINQATINKAALNEGGIQQKIEETPAPDDTPKPRRRICLED